MQVPTTGTGCGAKSLLADNENHTYASSITAAARWKPALSAAHVWVDRSVVQGKRPSFRYQAKLASYWAKLRTHVRRSSTPEFFVLARECATPSGSRLYMPP